MRVYHQVQAWLGNDLGEVERWGWRVTVNGIFPVETRAPLIPNNLLEAFSCECDGVCNTTRCTCKFYGISCSIMCLNCANDCGNYGYNEIQHGDIEHDDIGIDDSSSDSFINALIEESINTDDDNNSEINEELYDFDADEIRNVQSNISVVNL